MSDAGAQSWARDVFEALQALNVRQVAYVPDAGHRDLIARCIDEPSMLNVPLTTEEEGVAHLAGAWLGGARGVLLMQSSGIGNCVNMLSLTRVCRFPLLSLVTMRGQWGEFNPWQVPMGQNAEEVLRLTGTLVFSVEHAAELGETVAAAGRMVFESSASAAVLISQRLVGFKTFGK